MRVCIPSSAIAQLVALTSLTFNSLQVERYTVYLEEEYSQDLAAE